ncbi:MAG TPA: hypothetical protein EYP36_05955 [Calditrichaeota bacterium]|nr:hypothetical protein [Calditrichota bacterium]
MNLKIIFLVLLFSFSITLATYPEKPVTFIVHSKPGSGIDITTRQFTRIAAKYTDATFVVENKTGGSGIIAMREVLSRQADGYTILAMTKSFLSTILLSKSGIDLDDFYLLTCLVIDPEVLITNRHSQIRTLEDIINDAKVKQGRQKWLGPLVGGVDHLMAVKVWEKLGIHGEWIPFEGGSDALAALLGQHGVVYVGNPVDVKGRPDLMIAAVSAEHRLPEFPEAPTFKEMGYDLTDDVLWRGYALKNGVPQEALRYLEKLFAKVGHDSEWTSFVRKTAAQPVVLMHEAFSQMVEKDKKESLKYLKIAGILSENFSAKIFTGRTAALVIFSLLLLILLALYFFKREWLQGEIVISLILMAISFFLYSQTFNFPLGKLSKTAGPAAMPRMWIYGLLIFNLWLIIKSIRGNTIKETTNNGKKVFKAAGLVLLTTVYLLVVETLGYYLSTFLFLIVGMYWMAYRRHAFIFIISAGFTLFSYYVFQIILMVPLPKGSIWF